MTVPQPSFGPLGFVAPDEADILVAVKAEINAAFGNTLNMADETPQGQIAVSQTAAIGNANDSFVFLSQQFDPAYNSGRYQDAIARIYFISRNGALPTSVPCDCGGLPGVVIPEGSLAQDAAGNTYVSTVSATIGSSATVSVSFANTIPGPTPCPANTLNVIFQAINGWDTINNPADGIVGRNTETPQAFEARRFASVANNSVGYLSAIRGAVLGLPNVIDCYVTENDSNSPVSIGGVTLGPNSLYVAVVGGDPAQIAQAIWSKKAPGCAYNGNTSVTVLDSNSGYNPPFPAYAVSFEIPAPVTVSFLVNMQTNPSVPANAVSLIQNAITNAFIGGDGGPAATIGAEILASRFYSAVIALGTWAQVRFIQIGSTQNPDATFIGSIALSVLTVSAVTSGAIQTSNAQLYGVNVADGTLITNQLTGTPGGIGTYGISNSQTVNSTSMSSVSSDLNTITPNINLAPTTDASQIQVVFA